MSSQYIESFKAGKDVIWVFEQKRLLSVEGIAGREVSGLLFTYSELRKEGNIGSEFRLLLCASSLVIEFGKEGSDIS